MMRSAGNFSPEWGYLAPVPSMLRTVRVVLVATAVGATAGAGVVLSLVDRPSADGDTVAVAAHAIVTNAYAAPVQESQAVNGAAVTAAHSQVQAAQPEQGGQAALTAPMNAAPANETPAASGPERSSVADSSVAATSEPSAVTGDPTAGDQSDQSFVGPQQPPQQKKPKHHTAVVNNRDFIGAALRHLFSARAGAPYYPSRGL